MTRADDWSCQFCCRTSGGEVEASAMAGQKGFNLGESSFDTKSEAGQDQALYEKLRMRSKVSTRSTL